jgi:hypothetical protein
LKIEAVALHKNGAHHKINNLTGFKAAGDIYHESESGIVLQRDANEAQSYFFFTDYRQGLIGHVLDKHNSKTCYSDQLEEGKEFCKVSVLIKYLKIDLHTIKFKTYYAGDMEKVDLSELPLVRISSI